MDQQNIFLKIHLPRSEEPAKSTLKKDLRKPSLKIHKKILKNHEKS